METLNNQHEVDAANPVVLHLTKIALEKTDPIEQAYYLHAISRIEAQPPVPNGINAIIN